MISRKKLSDRKILEFSHCGIWNLFSSVLTNPNSGFTILIKTLLCHIFDQIRKFKKILPLILSSLWIGFEDFFSSRFSMKMFLIACWIEFTCKRSDIWLQWQQYCCINKCTQHLFFFSRIVGQNWCSSNLWYHQKSMPWYYWRRIWTGLPTF